MSGTSRAVAGIAAAAVILELAVSGRYGYQRDELYFIVCGQHLAFGYVDQPPLAPLLSRLSSIVFGPSIIGLRVVPALCLGLMVLVTAAIAGRFGAGPLGQLLAAVACASSSEYLAAGHLLTTTILDYCAWGLTLYFAVRLLDSLDPRWWLATGLAVGIGLDAKWNIGFLVLGLTVGLLVTPSRHLLGNRYALFAAVLALAVGSPDLIWQTMHGWPNLDVFRALEAQAAHNRAVYWPVQVTYTGLALAPLWIAAFVWFWRDTAAARFRPLGVAAAAVLLLVFVTGGKPYYCGGIFTLLFAAGATKLEPWAARSGRRMATMIAVMLASSLLVLPLALPVLPARTLQASRLGRVAYPADTTNWPSLVGVVAKAYDALPSSLRSTTVILAGDYGEAAAITVVGAHLGLPGVYCGQNNFWLWGPPPEGATSVLAVGIDRQSLEREFVSVRLVGVLAQSGIGYLGLPVSVYIATGLRAPWTRTWWSLRRYD
jgi:4-amino-4-deoxy-L-arabinose transferase-like glycosyltransferase